VVRRKIFAPAGAIPCACPWLEKHFICSTGAGISFFEIWSNFHIFVKKGRKSWTLFFPQQLKKGLSSRHGGRILGFRIFPRLRSSRWWVISKNTEPAGGLILYLQSCKFRFLCYFFFLKPPLCLHFERLSYTWSYSGPIHSPLAIAPLLVSSLLLVFYKGKTKNNIELVLLFHALFIVLQVFPPVLSYRLK